MTNPQPLTGLTDAEVVESRRLHGDNVLTPPAKEPLWRKFLAKLTDPLIIILLVAAALSIGIAFYEYFGLGHDATAFLEPVGILLAVVLATGLAFIFETKADREFDILNKVNDDEPVRVIRNGQSQQIPKRDVVAGDVVMIGTGDEIPADGTLIDAVALMVDESSLTGEPACAKTTDSRDFDPEATFPSNRVMRGTKVMEGHGVFRAEAVGDRTENGKVFQAAQIDNSIKTPLDEQLERRRLHERHDLIEHPVGGQHLAIELFHLPHAVVLDEHLLRAVLLFKLLAESERQLLFVVHRDNGDVVERLLLVFFVALFAADQKRPVLAGEAVL